ncbi:hypothetical protein CIPAW_07G069300 [Carya illinoinensis]|uniref:Retrotransposon gag domain-containing protein n=1 Tax=Carya illinoinensis TaxID=32201 RepID=A0A8T1Q0P6_CARIL|nr:hypothetical protein CIPAW_07G069300 [Carya illinoinensis]
MVMDPTSWIYMVEQFFDYQQIEEAEKLPLATYYLEVHFDTLSKLRKTGSVWEYQVQFEQLLSWACDLVPNHQLGCFISGVKDPIRIDVQAARPVPITDAIILSRLYEARHARKPIPVEIKRPMSMEPTPPPLPSTNLSGTKTPPIRRLNPSELQERRKKGLWLNCDENFLPGHRCKKLLLIEGIYTQEEEMDGEGNKVEQANSMDEPRISLHPIVGSTSPQTMRICGVIKGHGITVLLHSGSSHNFLNNSLAKAMGLTLQHTQGMKVMVANGEKLDCKGRCDGIKIFFHGTEFTINFFYLK